MNIPAIQCAKCQKVVDKTVINTNEEKRLYEITVHCHGETDYCELTAQFLQQEPFNFVKALAFQPN